MAKRERGTGGLIKIKGCRFWYAQYYDSNGRQIRVSTKTASRQEAQGVLRNLMSDNDRGILPITDLKKIRYRDLRKALLGNYVERGNKSLQTLANGEETIWGLAALDEFFGYKKAEGDKPEEPGVPITKITTDSAREFVSKRQVEDVGSAAINRSLALLRRMLRLAYEDGKIQVVPKIRLLKEPPARRGFLAREKFDELLTALPNTLKPLVTFLYYCGVRLGEARQIQWAQVDLGAGLIRLEDEQVKNSEARTVPLPDALIKMLEPIEPKQGIVFQSTNLRKEWCKACAAVGLGTLDTENWRYEGLIIHDLRRSAIRNLVAAGVPERVAMAISGHRTRSIFDRYHIVNTDDVQKAMRQVEKLAPVRSAPRPRNRRMLGT